MLGFRAVAEKADFVLSGEVDAAEWVKLEDAPGLLREGSIAWQLVRAVRRIRTYDQAAVWNAA